MPELTQGTNIIDASKEAGVKFIAFRCATPSQIACAPCVVITLLDSTLPSVKELSGGKYSSAMHFESTPLPP